MKTPEQIIEGLTADIEAGKKKIEYLSPSAYLHGDAITWATAQITFANNLINWIKSE